MKRCNVHLHVHNCKCKGRRRTCGVVCQVRHIQAALGAIRQLHLIVLVGTLQRHSTTGCAELGTGGTGANGMALSNSDIWLIQPSVLRAHAAGK